MLSTRNSPQPVSYCRRKHQPGEFDSRFIRIPPISRFAAASIITRWQHGKQIA